MDAPGVGQGHSKPEGSAELRGRPTCSSGGGTSSGTDMLAGSPWPQRPCSPGRHPQSGGPAGRAGCLHGTGKQHSSSEVFPPFTGITGMSAASHLPVRGCQSPNREKPSWAGEEGQPGRLESHRVTGNQPVSGSGFTTSWLLDWLRVPWPIPQPH